MNYSNNAIEHYERALSAPPKLTNRLIFGDDAPERQRNSQRNLMEGRTIFWMITAERPKPFRPDNLNAVDRWRMDNARREEEYARQRRTEERERCEEQAAVDQIRAEMQREVANLRAEMLREREFVLEVVGTAIGEFSNKRAFAIALALGGVPGSGNSDGSLLN